MPQRLRSASSRLSPEATSNREGAPFRTMSSFVYEESASAQPPLCTERHTSMRSASRRSGGYGLVLLFLGLGFGLLDRAVLVLRLGVHRVELQLLAAAVVDDVVPRAGGNDERRLRLNARLAPVHLHDAAALLDPKKLIDLVHFLADVLSGLEAHDNELLMVSGEQHLAKIAVSDRLALDVRDVAVHRTSLRMWASKSMTRTAVADGINNH